MLIRFEGNSFYVKHHMMYIRIHVSHDYRGDNMDDYVDQSMVFFKCNICEFEFQADPNFIPIVCSQCGSEDTYRI